MTWRALSISPYLHVLLVGEHHDGAVAHERIVDDAVKLVRRAAHTQGANPQRMTWSGGIHCRQYASDCVRVDDEEGGLNV